jgi:hypothetical protein
VIDLLGNQMEDLHAVDHLERQGFSVRHNHRLVVLSRQSRR